MEKQMNTFERMLARPNGIPFPSSVRFRIINPGQLGTTRTNMDSLIDLLGPNVARVFCGMVAFGFGAAGQYYTLNAFTILYSSISSLF